MPIAVNSLILCDLTPLPGIIVILLAAISISFSISPIPLMAESSWPDVKTLSTPISINSSNPLIGSIILSNAH